MTANIIQHAPLRISTKRQQGEVQRTIVNDASGLNPTPVFRHWIARSDEDAVFIAKLRRELREAALAKRPVAVGAARHSMGGQSLARNGTAITLNMNRCEPDTRSKTFLVNAGTRWDHVIATLDPLGFSPAVMQSWNDFGVASSFCVNAHGWPVPFGPFGSTVRAIRLMLADGSIVTCSRTENSELFSLAMGGYGLFGVVLELELDMVENCALQASFELMPSNELPRQFLGRIDADKMLKMAYARLSVARRSFWEAAVMVSYRSVQAAGDGLPPVIGDKLRAAISRAVFRAQEGSELGKRLRWLVETSVVPLLCAGNVTRNSLMNHPIATLGRNPARADVLQEYFLPPEKMNEFVSACQEIIPTFNQECLNVTLRYVGSDSDSVLAFAPTRRIAAVLAFSQKRSIEADADMLQMTEELIDQVLAIGGSFYLPYRLHARADQVLKAYPAADRFIRCKYRYDSGLLFRNYMWDAYFSG
jgi:FAD/FMN-containing dehydrogenase